MNTMKREREHQFESISMANCLMLLSRGGEFEAYNSNANISHPTDRVFECKTCNRQFPSFQALGGHRASHKKPRLMGGDGELENGLPAKPKTHECSVCGLEFAIGQALGGHMRRHRVAAMNDNKNQNLKSMTTTSSDRSSLSYSSSQQQLVPLPSVVKKAVNSRNRRVLLLDLNLTPFENDLDSWRVPNNYTLG